MSDFTFAWRSSVINFFIHDQTAAHATPERDVKNRIETDPCSVQGFAQRRHVRIIIDKHRSLSEGLQPIAQRKVRPPFDLMRARNLPEGPINRPPEANACGDRLTFSEKRP